MQIARQTRVDRELVAFPSQSFQHVVAKLEASVGHPDMRAFGRSVIASKTFADVQRLADESIGPSGFMEMARFDAGEILRKETGADSPGLDKMPAMTREWAVRSLD
jgi:hypothetical protein